MSSGAQGRRRPVAGRERARADALKQRPGERPLDKELRLLALLDPGIAPIPRLDGIPVDLVESHPVAPVLEVPGACIGQGEGPPPVALGPVDRFAQAGLQMHDGILATAIREFAMIFPVDHKEHDGARTEIERHAVADMEPGMAFQ